MNQQKKGPNSATDAWIATVLQGYRILDLSTQTCSIAYFEVENAP